MKKHFNDFTEEEQIEILQINYENLSKIINRNILFDNFISIIDLKKRELGLNTIPISYNDKIYLKNSHSIRLLYIVNKLIIAEDGNIGVIEMLKKAKICCDLMAELTLDDNFAKIEAINEQTSILFVSNLFPVFKMQDQHILFLLNEMKEYSQKQDILKNIRKIELQRMYGSEINLKLTSQIFSFCINEIKTDLIPFISYLSLKIEQMKEELNRELKKILEFDCSVKNLKEILEKRPEFVFDTNDYLLSFVNETK